MPSIILPLNKKGIAIKANRITMRVITVILNIFFIEIKTT
jgi:hypothetical protein